MTTLSTTTELEAVNSILQASGDAATQRLTGAIRPQVATALRILHDASRDVQTEGYDFNTDIEWPLQPDSDGNIIVPADCLAVDVSDIDARYDIVQRNGKLYNRTFRTYMFDGPIRCDITWFLPFDSLPQAAKAYVTRVAGRRYQASVVGADILYQFTKEDEVAAKIALDRAHANTEDNNFLTGSYTVARIIRGDPNNADL